VVACGTDGGRGTVADGDFVGVERRSDGRRDDRPLDAATAATGSSGRSTATSVPNRSKVTDTDV